MSKSDDRDKFKKENQSAIYEVICLKYKGKFIQAAEIFFHPALRFLSKYQTSEL